MNFLGQQTTVMVKPHEIKDVLVNPGIEFTIFQRFNGDTLNRVAGIRWEKFTSICILLR